jgi:hypothetical protein
MFDSILKQFTGGGGNVADSELHGGLSTLLSQAEPQHATGAVGDALQSLGAGGFAQSVQSAAENHGPNERGQIGSMLMQAISQGGGNPAGVLSKLGIGTQNASEMSSSDLGALAGHVAENHGGALASLLGGGAAGAGGGGGGMESTVLHLLGNPMVKSTAMNLAKKFM